MIFHFSTGEISLLGVGGGGGGGSIKGASFIVDTEDKRMTRLKGPGIRVDVDSLEVQTSGGTLKFNPNNIEFSKGTGKWKNTFTENRVSLHHNDDLVAQFDVTNSDSGHSKVLSLPGTVKAKDLLLDKVGQVESNVNLCMSEAILSAAQPIQNAALAEMERQQKRKGCDMKYKDNQMSTLQVAEFQSRILLLAASEIESLKAPKLAAANSGAISKEVDEKLEMFKSEVISNNREFSIRIGSSELKTTEFINDLNSTITMNKLSLVSSLHELKEIVNGIEAFHQKHATLPEEIADFTDTIAQNISDVTLWITDVNSSIISLQANIAQIMQEDLDKLMLTLHQAISDTKNDTLSILDEHRSEVSKNLFDISAFTREKIDTLNASLSVSIESACVDALANVTLLKNETIDNIRELSVDIAAQFTAAAASQLADVMSLNNSLSTLRSDLQSELLSVNESLVTMQATEAEAARGRAEDLERQLSIVNDTVVDLSSNLTISEEYLLQIITSNQFELISNVSELSANISAAITESYSVLNDVIGDVNTTLHAHKEETAIGLAAISTSGLLGLAALKDQVWENITAAEKLTALQFMDADSATKESLESLSSALKSKILAVHENATKSIEASAQNVSDYLLHLVEQRQLSDGQVEDKLQLQAWAIEALSAATFQNISEVSMNATHELRRVYDSLTLSINDTVETSRQALVSVEQNLTDIRNEYVELHAGQVAGLHDGLENVTALVAHTNSSLLHQLSAVNESFAVQLRLLRDEAYFNASVDELAKQQQKQDVSESFQESFHNQTLIQLSLLSNITQVNDTLHQQISDAVAAVNKSIAWVADAVATEAHAATASLDTERKEREEEVKKLMADTEKIEILIGDVLIEASTNFSRVDLSFISYAADLLESRSALTAAIEAAEARQVSMMEVATAASAADIEKLSTKIVGDLREAREYETQRLENLKASLTSSIETVNASLLESKVEVRTALQLEADARETLEANIMRDIRALQSEDLKVSETLEDIRKEETALRSELASVVQLVRTNTETSIATMTSTVDKQLSEFAISADMKVAHVKEKADELAVQLKATDASVQSLLQVRTWGWCTVCCIGAVSGRV